MKKHFLALSVLAMSLAACGGNGATSSAPSIGVTSSEDRLQTVIYFDLAGGTTESDHSPKAVQAITPESFFFDVYKDGVNFRGWSYNGRKVFDQKGNQLCVPELAEQMTFVAVYESNAYLTITTNMPEAGVISGEGIYPYNTNVDVSVETNEGYLFLGWYYGDTVLSKQEVYKYMMWSEDVTIEAKFGYNSYKLSLKTNWYDYGAVSLKGGQTNAKTIETKTAYLSEVTISAYTKTEEHRFLGWYSGGELVNTDAVYSFVMPNKDYTLTAKWDEDHSMTYINRENVVEPTCTSAGGYDEVVYCSVCGEEMSREHKMTSALAHECVDWEFTGSQWEGRCERCGYIVPDSRLMEVGDHLKFGRYEQDGDASNGKEGIEWVVLEKEGNTATVISRYALDTKPYNTSLSVVWKTCTLRSWLNGDFYSAAFNDAEKSRVASTHRGNEDYPSTDNVWLLSFSEVKGYFPSNSARMCEPTQYARDNGASVYDGHCAWWLSNPGDYSRYGSLVYSDGSVNDVGRYVYDSSTCVRPALTITI